ncbi:MAG TPA: hypothetical protein VNW29_05705 [Candidatus Sulfotelmatobacter sp.]|nr:hypothetical protein [Candidatus Sulfotelmatobacter sp.]
MTTEQIKIEEYSTKNLNLSAFLSCLPDIKFVGAIKHGNEFFFKFTPKEKTEQLVNDYFSGIATVNPRDLFARLHDLKDLIFSQKGSIR